MTIDQDLFVTIVAAVLFAKVIAFFAGNIWRTVFGSKAMRGAGSGPEGGRVSVIQQPGSD